MVKIKLKKALPMKVENKYKLLSSWMNHIPDVIYFKDKKGKLVMVNEAYRKGAGRKMEDILGKTDFRSEEHTSELQSHSFISYAVFCLKKKKTSP